MFFFPVFPSTRDDLILGNGRRIVSRLKPTGFADRLSLKVTKAEVIYPTKPKLPVLQGPANRTHMDMLFPSVAVRIGKIRFLVSAGQVGETGHFTQINIRNL